MQVGTIPGVYGRALLAAAESQGRLAEIAEEVEALRGVLDAHPELAVAIESPRLARSKKRAILEKTLRGRTSDTLANFVLLVVDRRRELELRAILAAFGRLHDAHIGLVRASVVSAAPLAPQSLSSLERALAAKIGRRVVLAARVDPEILGGLIVRFDGMVADGSLQTALEDIRLKMSAPKFGSELVHEN